MASWWERFPGRLEFEIEDFAARGLRFERDDALFRDAGRLLLRGTIEHGGEHIALEVLYPDLFPYLRPEVYAPELRLGRHQEPLARNLCLLSPATTGWKLSETGGWLVAERVPELLSLFQQDEAAMRAAETPQGEPISGAFGAHAWPGTAIFVPAGALSLPAGAEVGSGRLMVGADIPAQVGLRALLGELVARPGAGKNTRQLMKAEPALAARFGAGHIQMRWVRLADAPAELSAEGILAAAESVQAGFGRPPWQAVADGEIAVTGVVFPEEVRQGEYEDAWVFAVRFRRRTAAGQQEGVYPIVGQRLAAADLGARIPKLAPLRNASIAQIGLGALGGPLALELARNQAGTLRLLEHDRVEAGQIVRWPFGLQAVGRFKLNMIASFIEADYPFTVVERFQHGLGQTAYDRHGRGENEFDLLDRLLDGTALVIDASAELRIQQLVADLARDAGVPQLFVSATEGARGGQVGLVVPGRGGCWFCWKLWADAAAAGGEGIPLPPYEEEGTVQPRGCAFPTFTGASFDLAPIVAQAARGAAAALSADPPGSTVWICAIGPGEGSPPQWSTHPLRVHPDCPYCNSA